MRSDKQVPAHPITAAAAVHRSSHAAQTAAFDRLQLLLEPIGLDLIDEEDASKLLPVFKKAHGCMAETELARYLVAREVNEAAGRREDDDFEAFEAIPIVTTADFDAYVAYAKEHADAVHGGERDIYLHRLVDRLGDLVRKGLT